MKKYAFVILLCCLSMLMSCTSYKSLVNYNESPPIPSQPQKINNYKPITIQASDILQIKVLSTNPIAVQPFNLSSGESGGGGLSGFLVNSEGFIDFPTIGKIELKGLNIEGAKSRIAELLSPYFEQTPIVQVRLTNFKINVNGEVNNPGSFGVTNDRISLIDAVTLAGDFTTYSSRDSILIIREQDGMRTFGYVNFNSPDVFNSPYFYLQQNDVLYVRPDKAIVNSVRDPATRFLPWISAAVSITALFITLSKI